MKPNVIVIGSSGHARVVIDILQQEDKYNIAGLLDRYRKMGDQTSGYQVLGKEEDLPQLVKEHSLQGVMIAIGDNFIRSKVMTRVRDICPNLPFVRAIHPRSIIATGVSIGEGTAIMAGATINSGSSVGRFCVLNTNSSLDHDSIMEDFASLAPRATTGGYCHIEEHSAISIGAVLIHGVHIGKHSIIGAASLVMKEVAPFVVAYGTPAKIVRNRQPGDKYL